MEIAETSHKNSLGEVTFQQGLGAIGGREDHGFSGDGSRRVFQWRVIEIESRDQDSSPFASQQNTGFGTLVRRDFGGRGRQRDFRNLSSGDVRLGNGRHRYHTGGTTGEGLNDRRASPQNVDDNGNATAQLFIGNQARQQVDLQVSGHRARQSEIWEFELQGLRDQEMRCLASVV